MQLDDFPDVPHFDTMNLVSARLREQWLPELKKPVRLACSFMTLSMQLIYSVIGARNNRTSAGNVCLAHVRMVLLLCHALVRRGGGIANRGGEWDSVSWIHIDLG